MTQRALTSEQTREQRGSSSRKEPINARQTHLSTCTLTIICSGHKRSQDPALPSWGHSGRRRTPVDPRMPQNQTMAKLVLGSLVAASAGNFGKSHDRRWLGVALQGSLWETTTDDAHVHLQCWLFLSDAGGDQVVSPLCWHCAVNDLTKAVFAVHILSKRLSKPAKNDTMLLKRFGRYLMGSRTWLCSSPSRTRSICRRMGRF